jgi:hypothetical protein
MKKLNIAFLGFLLFSLTNAFADTGRFSLGLVSSQFQNRTKSHNISEANNPLGYGLYLGVKMDEHVSFGFTGSYLNGDLKQQQGEETSYRGQAAIVFHPFKVAVLRPYFSAGLVYTYQSIDFSNAKNDENHVLQFRDSLGLEYNFAPGLAVNVDFALYNDVFHVIGTATSVGIRYMF